MDTSDRDFDLAMRKAEIEKSGAFYFEEKLLGRCGPIAGPRGSAFRFCMVPPAHLEGYIKSTMPTKGMLTIVTPFVPKSSFITRQRVPGSPIYVLNSDDIEYWHWEAIPGSEAGEEEMVEGSMHFVVDRGTSHPSDPTIEQFDPSTPNLRLYIVN